MQIGANDAMYPVMGAIKWMRTYFALLAAPLERLRRPARPSGLDRGPPRPSWSSIYLAVMAAFGVVYSPWAILALPAGVLTGHGLRRARSAAFAATQDKDTSFSTLYRFAIIPLFLFSGTFFPISQLPAWLQAVAYATPLYHGVALCRDLTLGSGLVGRPRACRLPVRAGSAWATPPGRRTFARRLVV